MDFEGHHHSSNDTKIHNFPTVAGGRGIMSVTRCISIPTGSLKGRRGKHKNMLDGLQMKETFMAGVFR